MVRDTKCKLLLAIVKYLIIVLTNNIVVTIVRSFQAFYFQKF